MKRLLILPVIVMLNGCPGGADRMVYGEWMSITIDSKYVCFTVNKKDVLDYYYLSSNKDNKVNEILTTTSKTLRLSYPKTCFNVELENGYQYYSKYTLNGVNYRYNFFIDNNGNVISLEGAH